MMKTNGTKMPRPFMYKLKISYY